MSLPRATSYMEALQAPAGCFADPDLAGGETALTSLGLPWAVSGSVATVFRVQGAGGRTWAVRCFVRPLDQERRRYGAIAEHLAGLDATWKVGFELQPRGINVDGDWWPVLKMAWAPGQPLLRWVEQRLWDPTALTYLAVRFLHLAEELRAAGVAHGDLQHGNLLVAPGGDLRLVDYDGMYVPGLHGWSGTERGHRNFQHPGREVADFGPDLDHFSCWVIYASLIALAVDPLLWGRLDAGEESLLFREFDLTDPGRSPALAALEATGDPTVRALAGHLRDFLAGPRADVPPLTTANAPVPTLAADSPGLRSPKRDPGAAEELSRRQSLLDALRTGGPPAPDEPAHEAPAHTHSPRFRGDLGPARTTLVAGAAAFAVLFLAALAAGGPLRLAAVVGAAAALGAAGRRLQQLYECTPEAAAARRARAHLAAPREAVAGAAAEVERLGRRRRQVGAAEEEAAAAAASRRAQLERGEEQELGEVEASLQAELAALAERERAVARGEQESRSEALHELQREVIDAKMAGHPLVASTLLGIGNRVVHRLMLDRVRTAADFTAIELDRTGGVVLTTDGRRLRVDGLQSVEANALLTWRRQMLARAQLGVPDALPPERVQAIRADHDRLRASLSDEAAAARERARERAEAVRARWRAEHERVSGSLQQVGAGAAHQKVELDRELARASKDVAEAGWHLRAGEGEVGPAENLGLVAYVRQAAGLPVSPRAGRP